jgi:hypothetical protein
MGKNCAKMAKCCSVIFRAADRFLYQPICNPKVRASIGRQHRSPQELAKDKSMVEIFLLQFLTAALGAVNAALADWAHNRGRISRRLHTFWISTAISAIYLPILLWTSNIYLGPGVLGRSVAGIIAGAIFLCVYRNLPKPRRIQNPGLYPSAPHLSSGRVPPMSKFNG